MYIHDISVDVFDKKRQNADINAKIRQLESIDADDEFNRSEITMSTRCGTHIAAPRMYLSDGKAVTDLRLNTFCGKCTVVSVSGVLTGEDMDRLLPYCRKRILFRGLGDVFLSHSAAIVLAQSRVVLVGTDGAEIAPPYDRGKVGRELANAEIAMLGGLNLENIADGEYELCAFPARMGGLEAAPCRAILFEQEKGLN